jgi:hypothetical protein
MTTPTQAGKPQTSPPANVLRLRIVGIDDDQVIVSLALPVGLVHAAHRLGARLLPPDITIEEVQAYATQQGVAHLAWTNIEHRERLELTVE